MDEPGVPEELDRMLLQSRDQDMIVFSPSDKEFIDYSNKPRDGYLATEVRLYGLREDKVIDARLLDCSAKANCYFDRAYFLDNDTFVISEISRNIEENPEMFIPCAPNEECDYTFKVHVIDLKKNKRWIYESKPFAAIMDLVLPEL